jgi:hypothetical protein
MRLGTAAALCGFLAGAQTSHAWSNRGHRMVNLVAAETLPADMPEFIRTRSAIAEISYLGPEPDRWRPETAPELSKASSPDHFFRYEIGAELGALPRRRYDYLRLLDNLRQQRPGDAGQLTPQYTGTLPWQAEEVYERLVTAFVDYRLVLGDVPSSRGTEMVPMSKEDLPSIEAAALYYAGWLGHYIGDGCMPLHASVNLAGWAQKDNPNSYTTKGSIHHQLEVVADQAIEEKKITSQSIERFVASPKQIHDPFADTLGYLHKEGSFAEQVYRFDKLNAVSGSGAPELDEFIEKRMAEGSGMLRDLIYSAWLQSKEAAAPELPETVTLR